MDNSSILLSALDEHEIAVTPLENWKNAVNNGHPEAVGLRRRESIGIYTVYMHSASELSPSALPETPAVVAHGGSALVVGERLNARTMAAYRNRGVNYIDLAGNAYLKFGDVLIDIQGRNSGRPKDSQDQRTAPTNLFSTRRAQAIFGLIMWPELLKQPVKLLSATAGVSVGMAFQTIQLLRNAGYVIGDVTPKLVRRGELVDRWTDAYSTGLKNKLTLERLHGESIHVSETDFGKSCQISGEFAVPWLLRATTLTIYAERVDPELIIANRWRRDGIANIEIRKKFWTEPTNNSAELLAGSDQTQSQFVPALLIYADLMTSGDSRQREAARAFREEQRGLLEG